MAESLRNCLLNINQSLDVYCNEYHEDEGFVQPLNSNGKPMCTIAKTNIICIRECK